AYAKLTLAREIESASVTWLRGGPALLLPPRDAVSVSFATAQSRPTFGTLDVAVAREPGSDSSSAAVSPFLNVRSSDRLQWSIGPTVRVDRLGWQPVARPTVPSAHGG